MTSQYPTQPGWAAPTPPPPQPPPPKPPLYRRGWVLGIAGLVVGLALGGAMGGADTDPQSTSAAPVTSIVERPFFTTDCNQVDNAGTKAQCERIMEGYDKSLQGPAPTPTTVAKLITDGVYEVGLEIKPGTYKTSGDCYWARLADPDSENILANHAGNGPMTLRVRPTDKFVELSGGCEWRKVA